MGSGAKAPGKLCGCAKAGTEMKQYGAKKKDCCSDNWDEGETWEDRKCKKRACVHAGETSTDQTKCCSGYHSEGETCGCVGKDITLDTDEDYVEATDCCSGVKTSTDQCTGLANGAE